MGVVNVTPDSFSDGGRFLDPQAAIAHGRTIATLGRSMAKNVALSRSMGLLRIPDDALVDIDKVGGNSLVALDTVTGFDILLTSPHPKRFVVTSDRDFEAAIAEPFRHQVKYFVVPQPTQRGFYDRINQSYPGLWANGGGFAVLERELGGGYRMYRLTSAPR